MTDSLPTLTGTENLGRRIRGRRKAKLPINERVFKQRTPNTPISVDRVDHAAREELAELGIAQADRLSETFRGWAILKVSDAEQHSRTVQTSPELDNPYHAEIHLNIPDGPEQKDDWTHSIAELASAATWEAWQ